MLGANLRGEPPRGTPVTDEIRMIERSFAY
jgi:hypothetical protein